MYLYFCLYQSTHCADANVNTRDDVRDVDGGPFVNNIKSKFPIQGYQLTLYVCGSLQMRNKVEMKPNN